MKKIITSFLMICIITLIGVNNVFAELINFEEGFIQSSTLIPNPSLSLMNSKLSGMLLGATGPDVHSVFVELYKEDIETKKLQEDTAEIYWSLNKDLTDYEISHYSETSGNNLIRFESWDDEAVSTVDHIHHIQIKSRAEKDVIESDTDLFVTEINFANINGNDEYYYGNGASFNFSYVDVNGNQREERYYIGVEELDYIYGDINRDYDVNFFDIIDLISLVYDTPQGYVWDENTLYAANIDPENIETPDFFSITTLIANVYGAKG